MMRRLFLLACVVGTTQVASASTRDWLTDDFFVENYAPQELFSWPARPTRPSDCRAQIARAVCVVNSRFEHGDSTMSRGCMGGSERYVQFFEGVYDRFPPVLQRMFCSVGSIYVERQLESVAYGGLDGGGRAVVGIRKSVIDEALDISTLISWKEQLPFGGRRDAYEVSSELPAVEISSAASGVAELAYYVLAHEFGHLFDFSNDVNSFTNCSIGVESDRCRPQQGSWTSLSWQSGATPRPEFDYPHRGEVCYYNCRGRTLGRSAIAELYAGFAKSGFVSVYASTNVYDDFAETLAFYMLAAHPEVRYTLDTRQGERYDMLAKLSAPVFAEKAAYMDAFLQRSNLNYP